MYNELKHTWDIVVVAYFRYYISIYLNGLSVRILGVPSEIQTQNLVITRQNYHCTRQPKSLSLRTLFFTDVTLLFTHTHTQYHPVEPLFYRVMLSQAPKYSATT